MSRVLQILFVTAFLTLLCNPANAKHIKGGEIHYTYLGPSTTHPGWDLFQLRLRLFISCQSRDGQIDAEEAMAVYRNSDGFEMKVVTAGVTLSKMIYLSNPSPCIINPSPVCYWIREYTANVDLPKDPGGYSVIFQRCCRIDGIKNIFPNVNVGASYFCEINGTNSIGATGKNSNPDFGIKDTVLICQGKRFRLDYSATDTEGDSLTYEFAPGYGGGGINNSIVTNPGPPDSWNVLAYRNGFSGTKPLGGQVQIDRKTGLISGVAPLGGDYVVCVLVKEFRSGVLVTSHRKDFIVHVDDRCDFPSADLDPGYFNCNAFDFTFHNEAKSSPLIHTYYWDFGVPAVTTDTSSLATPTYTFPDTGVYQVHFIVNRNEPCTDSATTLVSIFPGFSPGFISQGTCMYRPVIFQDTTKSAYGRASSWYWDFGDAHNGSDTSTRQNPSYQYSDTGTKQVTFIVQSTKGCRDTVVQTVQMLDKPLITLPFTDTLICNIDTLQLHAEGFGTITWSPTFQLINPDSPNPLVFPKTTTTYKATIDQSGCINSDSVTVNVVDRVTLNPGNDSTICLGDTITLNPSGDGLYFNWTPASTLDNYKAKNPKATPTGDTRYTVTASIGKCFTTGSVDIKTVPYPLAQAGENTFICYDDTTQLKGSGNGSRYVWSPAIAMDDPGILNPTVYPLETTTYFLLSYDTLGCPKPGVSKLTVEVGPEIHPFAGNDTSIVIGQPLKLHGEGAQSFLWYPNVALDRNDVQEPTAMLSDNQTYVMKTFTEEGCFGYDTINVKVFTTAPDIFVPNAFTPDHASNTIFRPIPVGISQLDYFRVYNRNGTLLYSTQQVGSGWDGRFKGQPQPVGGYVWMVRGTDYTGRVVAKKGTVVLIR